VTRGNPCFAGDIGLTNPPSEILIYSALAAEIKIGPERIGARTDGGLQIFIPGRDGLVAWDRSYYEIALEVHPFT
jgi:hypothetical protein